VSHAILLRFFVYNYKVIIVDEFCSLDLTEVTCVNTLTAISLV